MSSAIYPDPPRLVTAVCGYGEQQRLSNARLRLTFLLFPGYSLARARREIPDQSSRYLQPTLTAGDGTGEGGSRQRWGEKVVWEADRFNARVAHRLFMTARSKRRRARPT